MPFPTAVLSLLFLAVMFGGGLYLAFKWSGTLENEFEQTAARRGGWVLVALSLFLLTSWAEANDMISLPNPFGAPVVEDLPSRTEPRPERKLPVFEESDEPSETEKARAEQRNTVDEFNEHAEERHGSAPSDSDDASSEPE